MRRVFTKPICGSATFTGTVVVINKAVGIWTPEEDIVVIGVRAFCHFTGVSENDGMVYITCGLSQSTNPLQEGEIHTCVISNYWNTAPAGLVLNNVNDTVMLPEDHGIPVPEGTTLSIYISGRGKTAGTDEVCADYFVYYVKGKLTGLKRG